MRAGFKSQHWRTEQGKPAGGASFGTGFAVSWQNGPLGRGDDRTEPNGAFVEDVIAVAWDRLAFYQSSEFACEENHQAMQHLQSALDILDARTREREARQVEGTHER